MNRWLRRLAGAFLLTLATSIVWVVGEREAGRAKGQNEYAASASAADATDPGWRWDDLAASRLRPPEGRNGMDVVLRARAALPDDWTASGTPGSPPAEPPGPPNARLPPTVVAAARARLASVPAGIAVARTLKNYPRGYQPLTLQTNPWETLLPHIDAVRRVLMFLRWDGALVADAGNPDAAIDAADALMNLSRAIGDEPFLISQLVRFSVRVHAVRQLEHVLAQTEPDPARLTAMQAAWAAEADEPLLLHGLRGERAINDRMFENLLTGALSRADLARNPGETDDWFRDYAWWHYKAKLWRDRAALHEYLTCAVAVARLPAHEQREGLAALPPPPPKERKVAALFTPAVEKCAIAFWRSTAQLHSAATALACERYRRSNGRWPNALSDLTPAFLPTVPLDPFDGQPLRYRRLPDGVAVYSLGENRVDDGATLRPAEGVGPAPDEGIRLWDLSARRAALPGG